MPRKKPPADAERAAFRAAICAAPEDDTPRLVFADWLDEHGEADRAEFIRLGCEHVRLARDDPRWWPQENRLRELEEKHEEWVDEAPPWARRGVSFRRGFIDGIVTSATLWLKRADKLLETVPLTGVRLERVRELLPEVVAAPSLARLRWLSLGWNNLEGTGRTLAAAPVLANLRALALNIARLGHEDVRALAGSRHLAGLTVLDLRYNRFGDAGATALAKSRHLLQLTRLDLSENRIGAAGVRALAGSPVLANVWNLALHANFIGDAGAIALANAPQLRSLRELALGSNAIGDAGVAALASAPHLAGLKRLYLHSNPIGVAGARALAESPVLGALEDLTFPGRGLAPKVAKALQKRFGKKVVRL